MSSPPELEFRPPPVPQWAVAISIYISMIIFTFYLYLREYGSLWGAHFSKNSVSFRMNRDISVLFEDLTSVEAPPPMGGCMGGWVG